MIRGHTHLADGAEASIVGALATLERGDQLMHHLPLPRLPDRARHRHEGDHGRDLRPPRRAVRRLRRLDAPRRSRTRVSWARAGSSARASRRPPAWLGRSSSTGRVSVVLCFFGDGASKQGAFHEIAQHRIAVEAAGRLRDGEQQLQRRSTRVEQEDANAAAGEPLSVKAQAYSMPGVTIDGGDPVAVYDTVGAAVSAPATATVRRWSSRSSTGSRPTATSSLRRACRCTTRSTRRSRCSAIPRSTRRRCAATRYRASARG